MDYETSKNKLSTKCIDRIVIYITEIVEKLIESKDFSDSKKRSAFKNEGNLLIKFWILTKKF